MVMQKLELPLSQTQKVRFERAIERLQSLSSTANSDSSVIVTDSIPVNHDDAFLKGHGTSEVDGELLATVCGVVERVDKLVYVRTLRARYKPEVGDIVVGRVIEVSQNRWRVELNFTQDGVLMLSSMTNPDGGQRRRTSVDELNMRNIFVEHDVVCSEVRTIQHDGSLQLHARSEKYGKLEKGQLLKVDPYLIKRTKPHFHHIESLGIDLILGCNGFIWVGEHVEVRDPLIIADQKDDEMISSPTKNTVKDQTHIPLETRQTICRLGNAIRVLSNLGFTMTLEVIMETFNLSNSNNIDIYDMLGSEFHVVVTENEAERRRTKRKN
ncbi:hypothetical protein AALP_AA1G027700 [Arabis alpina]|uniref:S1 motif domain-containing protein n=1 Tax=Arabis alpina TaxID=50452 RepID=A0A087HKP3_ARAAL|nr:hypothetical protein AALP_AA1G027700 [Arabis alpina]